MNIVIDRLLKRYGDQIVLNGFSAHIPQGKITCLMGRSGCGKTTLLHILMGLVQPDGGSIYGLDGLRISAVFQENRLCERLNAVSNVKLVCEYTMNDGNIKNQLENVGLLNEDIAKPVSQLSGGMKRRVAIVRAMAVPFDLVFMDEPFKGLDDETRQLVVGYLLQKLGGKTALIVTHDPAEARLLGGTVLEME